MSDNNSNTAINTAVYLLLQAFSDVVEQGWKLARFEVVGGYEIVGHFHRDINGTMAELIVRKRFVYEEPTEDQLKSLRDA